MPEPYDTRVRDESRLDAVQDAEYNSRQVKGHVRIGYGQVKKAWKEVKSWWTLRRSKRY